jgi:putative ABC transport system substrate-binding protein
MSRACTPVRPSRGAVAPRGFFADRRAEFFTAAARHAIPAICFRREFVADGGLASYGATLAALYRLAADRVDRILKGAILRVAGCTADPLRVRHQPAYGAAARDRDSGRAPRPRRRSDRMRRAVLLVLAAVPGVLPLGVQADEAAKVPRVGYLSPVGPNAGNELSFREGLRKLGYVEGRTIHVEYRRAEGQFDRLPELARELAAAEVAVIVASVTQASLAAKSATTRIPIVIAAVADPVAVGLVNSLARPGTNITGTSGLAAAIVGKQLEILNEVSAGAGPIAVLWNPANPAFQALQMREVDAAGQAMSIALEKIEARERDEMAPAFAAIARAKARAVLVLADPVFATNNESIARLATQHRLPAIGALRPFAEAGGLVAYGPSYDAMHQRAATYVDRILKGASAGDLPIEQATVFELVLNLKTARAMGLTIPAALLARADEVIE